MAAVIGSQAKHLSKGAHWLTFLFRSATRDIWGGYILFELIAKGGYVIVVILACSLCACAVIIERWLYYRVAERQAARLMPAIRGDSAATAPAEADGLVGKMWRAAKQYGGGSKQEVEAIIEETVRGEIPQLERNLYILVTIATISPLLGLLGTVLGMIKTFHVASLSGVGNPHMLAEGISEALYNTAGGLLVTIPCIIANNHFRSRVERLLNLAESYGGEMARLSAAGGKRGEN